MLASINKYGSISVLVQYIRGHWFDERPASPPKVKKVAET